MDRTSWYIETVLTNCQFITNTNLSFAILPYDGKEKESCGQKCSIVFTTYCKSAPCVEVGVVLFFNKSVYVLKPWPEINHWTTSLHHCREVTHSLVVRQVSQNEAAVLLLSRQRFVVEAAVFLFITQSEDLRERIQLGSDVGLQEVVALPFPSLQAAVSTGLQKLPEEQNIMSWPDNGAQWHKMT